VTGPVHFGVHFSTPPPGQAGAAETGDAANPEIANVTAMAPSAYASGLIARRFFMGANSSMGVGPC
jgi:hypothetical protein